jgi:hypothetical protein
MSTDEELSGPELVERYVTEKSISVALALSATS